MNPYVIGGMGAAIFVLGLLLKNSYEANGELEAKLERQANETIECTDANATNTETITTLRTQIQELGLLRASEAEDRERVLAERERELLRARARADELEQERESEQEENQDCAALAALDIESYCPATTEQLRVRSRGPGSHEDGDG